MRKYSLYILLENFSILGEETDYCPFFTGQKDSIEALIEANPILKFLTPDDVAGLKEDFQEAFDAQWDPGDFGELGGIWCREYDGLHYLYAPDDMKINGVYAMAITCDPQ
jgi:hypothetical protein